MSEGESASPKGDSLRSRAERAIKRAAARLLSPGSIQQIVRARYLDPKPARPRSAISVLPCDWVCLLRRGIARTGLAVETGSWRELLIDLFANRVKLGLRLSDMTLDQAQSSPAGSASPLAIGNVFDRSPV